MKNHPNIDKLAAFIGTLPDRKKAERLALALIASPRKKGGHPRKTA